MKRKLPAKPASPKQESVVPPQLLEGAKRSLSADRARIAAKCVVCGSETASSSSEPLCWVCRRLKISAWRDVEQQMPAQE
jgi:hypothetical protein